MSARGGLYKRYLFTSWVLTNDSSYRHSSPRIDLCEFSSYRFQLEHLRVTRQRKWLFLLAGIHNKWIMGPRFGVIAGVRERYKKEIKRFYNYNTIKSIFRFDALAGYCSLLDFLNAFTIPYFSFEPNTRILHKILHF